MTITEFLLARIAEDEQAATLATGEGTYYYDHAAEQVLDMGQSEGVAEEGIAHFRRFMPDRVLAECAAKRRIVERHSSCDDVTYGDASSCPDVRTLASVYADHPDYDPAWREAGA